MCCWVTALCKKARTALTPGSSELSYVSIYPKRSAETAVFSVLPWKALAVASTARNSRASWPVKCVMACVKNAAGLYPQGQFYLWDRRIINKTWRTTGLLWPDLQLSLLLGSLAPSSNLAGRINLLKPSYKLVPTPPSWFGRAKLRIAAPEDFSSHTPQAQDIPARKQVNKKTMLAVGTLKWRTKDWRDCKKGEQSNFTRKAQVYRKLQKAWKK